jgi:D-sedoheptulose 7-phosphate isomerase
MRHELTATFETAAENLRLACSPEYQGEIVRAVDMLCTAFESGRKLLVFGNGGSSSDAEHICGELVGRFLRERKGLPALSLSSNATLLTAWGNDYSFESVFERQVQALGQPGDVSWGISTSGNSENVVRAQRIARQLGLGTIGLTGEGGGRLGPLCDILLAAPTRETPRIQEVHLVTYHAICAAVEERLFGR